VRFAVVVADAAGEIAADGEHGLPVADAAPAGSSGTQPARNPFITPHWQAPNHSTRPAPKEGTVLALAEPDADTAGGVVATLGRPDGQTLTVRTVTEADVDGLDALFQGLSNDDRHHRFFSLRPPARTFVEQMTRAEDEGGYRLVAVASGPQDALVAEAGYAILPDGDGEFGLTVAAGWRGRRLGRYLLDAIVAAAAARGVPNLQADIMLGNTGMLALVRDRGYITLHRDEFSDMRIAIDAAQPARRRRQDAFAVGG
jgi:GNAT superfamily N-acetyltransferase